MPALSKHTHCQVAQKSSRTSQNLSKSMSAPTLKNEMKNENGIQHYLKITLRVAIAYF
jgi:hypothetical protein